MLKKLPVDLLLYIWSFDNTVIKNYNKCFKELKSKFEKHNSIILHVSHYLEEKNNLMLAMNEYHDICKRLKIYNYEEKQKDKYLLHEYEVSKDLESNISYVVTIKFIDLNIRSLLSTKYIYKNSI